MRLPTRLIIPHFINPRCACARGLLYLPLCVCLSVTTLAVASFVSKYARNKVRTALLRYSLDFKRVDFHKNASFRSYGVTSLPRQSPALLQRPLARCFDDRGF